MAVTREGTIAESQWADGLGAKSCELAHLGLGACAAFAQCTSQTLIRVFIDVAQAFSSVVVALSLPLPSRDSSTVTLLQELGFTAATIDEIIAEGVSAAEWGGTIGHMRQVLAAFQGGPMGMPRISRQVF